MRTPFSSILYSTIALIAFSANSILCRMALEKPIIDPAGFTLIRLLSGSLMLVILVWFFERKSLRNLLPIKSQRGESTVSFGRFLSMFLGALFLFIYAAGFSYAYISLDAGLGALILFAVVQITMIVVVFLRGGRLSKGEIIGLLISFSGFIYLCYPSFSGADANWYGLIFMALSGAAWGGYTLLGQVQDGRSALVKTTSNFILSTPFVLLLSLLMIQDLEVSLIGFVLAASAGAITSGLGYAIWYKALTYLDGTRAAVLQLLVPVLASAGGLVLLNEALTLHLIVSSVFVLGGIFIVITNKKTS